MDHYHTILEVKPNLLFLYYKFFHNLHDLNSKIIQEDKKIQELILLHHEILLMQN